MKTIQELIDKYKILDDAQQMVEAWDVLVDLTSLKESSQETWLEKLSDYMHKLWIKWYVCQKYNMSEEISLRWEKQAETPYEKLSEEDKEKDRNIVREILKYLPQQGVEIELDKIIPLSHLYTCPKCNTDIYSGSRYCPICWPIKWLV